MGKRQMLHVNWLQIPRIPFNALKAGKLSAYVTCRYYLHMRRFGNFEVDFKMSELRKSGVRIRIQDQQMRILQCLMETPGEVVTRDVLRQRLWPSDTFVDFDRSLNVAVAKLRQTLLDSADQPRYIETVSRKGYRFIAPVLDAPAQPNLVEPPISAQPATSSARSPIPSRHPLRLGTVAVLAACLAGWSVWLWPRSEADTRLVQLDLEVGKLVSQPAVSPDGKTLAFIADGRLALRRLDQSLVTMLPATEGASSPFFSADGREVAFFAKRKLHKISTDGGNPVILCDAPLERGGTWTEDGYIIAALGETGSLSRVPAQGGTPELFTLVNGHNTFVTQHSRPRALPGAAGVLYVSGTGVGEGNLFAKPLRGGEERNVIDHASGGWYLASGHVLFLRGQTLFSAPFDLRSLKLTGQPVPLIEGVMHDFFRGGDVDASSSGTLVYRTGAVAGSRMAVWLARSEVAVPALAFPGSYSAPRLSPDGRRLAVSSGSPGALEIWISDLRTGRMTLFSYGPAQCCPLWSPDGEFIVFSSGRSLAWARTDGSGKVRVLELERGSVSVPWSFSPDGRFIAFHRNQAGTGYDLWIVPVTRNGAGMELDSPRPLIVRPGIQAAPAISPDGRWLAYASDESGRFEVYVTRFLPDGKVADRIWRVSTEGGRAPKWDHPGGRIFFRSIDDRIMAVAVNVNS
ncbi:MAG: PD40 domain-containing protein, partial [Bryobacteraceae bacterium]|nr:PD40 domain-containing protein [Bryobacteraceae bacterium]